MAEAPPARTAIVLPWATLLKVGVALALAWAVLRLIPALVTVLIAVLLAITVEPLVRWLEQHRVPRALGAFLVTLAIVAVIGGVVWAAVPVVVEQSQVLAGRIGDFVRQLTSRLPEGVAPAVQKGIGASTVGSRATQLGASVLGLVSSAVLALALMLYLLVDGRRTYAYLLAYVAPRYRGRVGETAEEAQRIVSAYVAGQLLTSFLAAVFAFVVLSLLKVPAALVLAVLAGVLDLLPVVGFFLSLAPAVLLALTVSPTAALLVTVLYVVYNVVESYYIVPKIYGRRLELSDVAVLVAFVFGYELGGVIGAVLSLPIAAAYPTIERLWLAERLGRRVVREHDRIAETPPSEFGPPAEVMADSREDQTS